MAVSKRLRYEVLKRDGHACRYCGRTAPEVKLTIDHVLPITLGGSDDPDNLVTACADCNSGKSSSNPDAPLVANVADDALRWAQARQIAAQNMLGDLGRRQENARRFKVAWDRWTFGGRPVDLPDGWESSVGNFLAAGLPMEVLVDCIGKAMANSKIRFNNMFRYTCGIAWVRVRELNDRAALLTRDIHSPKPRSGDQYKEAVFSLFGVVPGIDDEAQRVAWATAFNEAHDPDYEDEEDTTDYLSWEQDVKALVQGVGDLTDRFIEYRHTVKYLLGLVPVEEKRDLLAESQDSLNKAGDPYTAEDVERYAVVLAFRKRQFSRRPEDAWS